MKIDECEIIRELSSGGYGRVFLVKNNAGEFFALKKVFSEKSAIKREFKALEHYIAKLKKRGHPNLIKILSHKANDENIEYIMPLADSLDGISNPCDENWKAKTLASLIEQRRNSPTWFSEKEISKIFIPLVSAVIHLSEQGLLHRDIKPENILFINGKPVLSDLGLISEDRLSVSSIGTPAFLPPSWFLKTRGNPDMWGLAISLYSLITGNPPDTIGRQAFRFPTGKTLSKEEKSTWNTYHKIIERAISENPNERFFRFEDFLNAFTEKKLEPIYTLKRRSYHTWYIAAFFMITTALLSIFAYPAIRRYMTMEPQATRPPYQIVEDQLKKSMIKAHLPVEKFKMFPKEGEGLYYKDLPLEIPPLNVNHIASMSPVEAVMYLYSKITQAALGNDNIAVVQYIRASDELVKLFNIRIRKGEKFILTDEFIHSHKNLKDGRPLRYYDIGTEAHMALFNTDNEYIEKQYGKDAAEYILAIIYAKALFNLGQPHRALKEIDEFIDNALYDDQEAIGGFTRLKGFIWQFTGFGLRAY